MIFLLAAVGYRSRGEWGLGGGKPRLLASPSSCCLFGGFERRWSFCLWDYYTGTLSCVAINGRFIFGGSKKDILRGELVAGHRAVMSFFLLLLLQRFFSSASDWIPYKESGVDVWWARSWLNIQQVPEAGVCLLTGTSLHADWLTAALWSTGWFNSYCLTLQPVCYLW